MTKHTTQIIDTVLFTVAAVFFFVMTLLYAALPEQPAPYAPLICLFLSLSCFGLAGYRISHPA